MGLSPNTRLNGLAIAIVVDEYPSQEDESAGLIPRTLARRLADRGHRISVFVPATHPKGTRKVDDVRVHRFPHPLGWESTAQHRGGGEFQLVSRTLRRFLDLTAHARRPGIVRQYGRPGAFDVVHGLGNNGAIWFSQALAAECGVSYVATPTYDAGCSIHGAQHARILSTWLKKASAITAPDRRGAELVQALSDRVVKVIPYGPLFDVAPGKLESGARPRVLHVGAWTHGSGVVPLIRALPLMLPEREITLVLMGDGDLYESLRVLCKDLAITRHVEFFRRPSVPQIRGELARCQLVIDPRAAGCHDPTVDANFLANHILERLRHRGRAARYGDSVGAPVHSQVDWNVALQRLEACYVQAIARQIQRDRVGDPSAGI